MVKIHKMFCIEQEIVLFLKGKNGSELVNRLLLEHMKDSDIMSMNIPQLKAEVEIERLEKELKKKTKELRTNANK